MTRLEHIVLPMLWLSSVTSAALVGSSTLQDFSSLVVFGDSYTDDGPEYYTPEPSQNLSTVTSTGGRIWPQYIQQYTGINLYDYAVSGAVCDTYFSPSKRNGVKQNQIPYFLKDKDYVGDGSLINPSNETIYAIWIGTNDLGPAAFFTDNRVSLTILDYIDCVYEQLDALHEAGARNFVLLNLAPLNFAPMYALPENGGTINTTFWKDEETYNANVTQVSEKMRQYVALINSIYNYRTSEEVQISDRYPASSFTIFDVHSLLSDMWNNPASYLNGTAPVNVTSTITACGAACNDSSVRDSYLWYDSLHPSEQTDRVIARAFVDIATGNSTWGRTWKSPSI
ncbi:acetyl esterase [Diaporthe amygdali]|uniref:acetyl esterase n=1 Tax=Phomopsis amygdali TaxID=1214568 RepID=UPI0022FE3B00|nr:acetyl esterase [Diaporthe amygdali]KAJ0114618.1 acetyl esterase [Diaporthe amygdali]